MCLIFHRWTEWQGHRTASCEVLWTRCCARCGKVGQKTIECHDWEKWWEESDTFIHTHETFIDGDESPSTRHFDPPLRVRSKYMVRSCSQCHLKEVRQLQTHLAAEEGEQRRNEATSAVIGGHR